MRTKGSRGFTAVEVIVSAVLGVAVLGGGIFVTQTSTEVARSSAAEDNASRHCERVLRRLGDELRWSSLGTLLATDGTALADGVAATGFRCRRVLGYEGATLLDTETTFQLVGAEVVRTQGGVQETIAREITSFTVTRNGDTLTIAVVARSGPSDDRGRTARGSITLRTRNS